MGCWTGCVGLARVSWRRDPWPSDWRGWVIPGGAEGMTCYCSGSRWDCRGTHEGEAAKKTTIFMFGRLVLPISLACDRLTSKMEKNMAYVVEVGMRACRLLLRIG